MGKPNKHPGKCRECSLRVEPFEGHLDGTYEGRNGKTYFHIIHDECPAQRQASSSPASSNSTQFTDEQIRCIELFETGEDLVVQAGAGTGKTTTLVGIAQRAKEKGLRGQYTAFNRSIVFESKPKFEGTGCRANTAHSLAWGDIGYRFKRRLDQKTGRARPRELAALIGLSPISVELEDGGTRNFPAGTLAGYVLQGIRTFCASTDDRLRQKHLPRVDGIDIQNPDGTWTWERNNSLHKELLPYLEQVWEDLSDPDGRLPVVESLIHSVYFKLWALNHPIIDADYILYDEAQDADPVTLQVLEAQSARGVQLIAVGDSQQEIYGWRGAVNALQKFEDRGAAVAYLTKSFRFGDAVAQVANKLLSRLESELQLQGFEQIESSVGKVDAPDAILTRTNAGAVRAVIEQIKQGRVPGLQGGVKALLAFAYAARALQRGQHPVEHADLSIFESWREVQEYVTEESGSDLKLWVNLIDDFGVDVVINNLNQCKDRGAQVIISTAHKAKGREWGQVTIGEDFRPPKNGDLGAAELRLAYVAVTRAQYRLDITAVPHFVTSGVTNYSEKEL